MKMIKYLEKKVEILPSENNEELNRNIELEYYLVESEIGAFDGVTVEKVYGIEIIKKTEEESCERKIITNYSCCAESVKRIVDKLANNTVTPVGLPFVLDDLLGA